MFSDLIYLRKILIDIINGVNKDMVQFLSFRDQSFYFSTP